MFKWLLPKSGNFFDFFEKHSALIVEASQEFTKLVSDEGNIGEHALNIKKLEVQADSITHKCREALHQTFITPFDRYDIYKLSNSLDDIIDYINETAQTMVVYRLEEMTPEVKKFASILDHSAQDLNMLIKGFRKRENMEELQKVSISIKKHENESDSLFRKAIGQLFDEEPDVRKLIKWKEIYFRLEQAVNRCEDVSNIVEGVILEMS